MRQDSKLRAGATRLINRLHAWRAARIDLQTGFVALPEPRSIGLVARGRQLVDGTFLFSGMLVDQAGLSIWDVARDRPEIADDIHGCLWLDDLAALGDDAARAKAQAWVFEWLARYGRGKGAGWTPEVTGRRVIRWINHGPFILRGLDKRKAAVFFRSLGQQAVFVARRGDAAPGGQGRLDALAGAIHGATMLRGLQGHIDHASTAMAVECERMIDPQGAIASRNPEELLEVLGMLTATRAVLTTAGHKVPIAIDRAIARIAPVLRALRHADGSLARFHGGGRGVEGRLDHALATSGNKTLPSDSLQMGYARLRSGRTTVIADAAAPPEGQGSANAHASTLGFELTSGRRPVIVNCGSGAQFGLKWHRASRATPSHSTMMIEGVSSSHLATRTQAQRQAQYLTEIPSLVRSNFLATDAGHRLELSHNGYQPTHGLTHARLLTLSPDGRHLQGEDLLTTLDAADEKRFAKVLSGASEAGIPFAIRFHLHPDVQTSVDPAGAAVSLHLKSGETWVLHHDGVANLAVSASVYLENGRLRPRAAQQVVLSGHALAYATRVRWSLAKTDDTPDFVRDLAFATPMDQSD